MLSRFSALLLSRRGAAVRLTSSLAGENNLPSNLLLPANLVDPSRPKRPPPPPDSPLPLLRSCDVDVPAHRTPVRMWVDTLDRRDQEALGVAELHPDVFAVPPRLDIIHSIEMWQRNYKRIDYAKTKVRSEVRGGGRKPWKQKGSGRARHGSIRSPIWRGGGVSHGPRGPTSFYYMPPIKVRVLGLKVALSSKMAQGYLHIVDSLDILSPDSQDLLDAIRHKGWGESVLVVNESEDFPANILDATATLRGVNLIPAIGLNVHSMLKHEALVLTTATLDFLEKKLLWHDQRYTPLYPFKLPYSDYP
ncbi:large ribosomal subunit protein uL4m [Nerophis lumbriciformis]|uniref:large ribosomal subunit protein uL4m n=1 Tax=Nerophis lumbriciformis TaxID=546530 RepID=UPI003BADB95A